MSDQSNDEPQAQFRAALVALHEGRPEKALRPLEALHGATPRDADIALNLGGTYIMLGRYEDAQEVLERAAVQAPDNPNVWVNLAAARLGPLELSSDSQQAGAIAAWEQALAVDPSAPNVHYMLGLVRKQRGEPLQAIAHFSRALETNPNDRDAQAMLDALSDSP